MLVNLIIIQVKNKITFQAAMIVRLFFRVVRMQTVIEAKQTHNGKMSTRQNQMTSLSVINNRFG
jgi:hypothetical protein